MFSSLQTHELLRLSPHLLVYNEDKKCRFHVNLYLSFQTVKDELCGASSGESYSRDDKENCVHHCRKIMANSKMCNETGKNI